MQNEPVFQTRIINKLYKKYKNEYPDLTEQQVRKVVYHQFRFVRKIMRKGEFESVRLPYFGLFDVNPKRLEKLQES